MKWLDLARRWRSLGLSAQEIKDFHWTCLIAKGYLPKWPQFVVFSYWLASSWQLVQLAFMGGVSAVPHKFHIKSNFSMGNPPPKKKIRSKLPMLQSQFLPEENKMFDTVLKLIVKFRPIQVKLVNPTHRHTEKNKKTRFCGSKLHAYAQHLGCLAWSCKYSRSNPQCIRVKSHEIPMKHLSKSQLNLINVIKSKWNLMNSQLNPS